MQQPLAEHQLGSPVTDLTVRLTGIARDSHDAPQVCSLVICVVGLAL